MVEAGTGLASAHACGLVHRDFKPDNILISRRGTARVTDFGLARRADLAMSSSAADRLSRPKMVDVELPPTVTRTGAIVGTPAYMAPEQAQGQPCDARADQFSFCVTAWEALWGQRPFAGMTWSEIYGNVVSGNLTPPPLRPYVPWGVRRALERGLSVDPAERWASMTDLLDMLEAAIKRPIRRRRLAAGAVTAVAASVLAVLAWNQGVAPIKERARVAPARPPEPAAATAAAAAIPAPPPAIIDAAPAPAPSVAAPTRKPPRTAGAVKSGLRPTPPSGEPATELHTSPPEPAADKRLSELGDALRGLEGEWRRRELLRGDLPAGFFDAMHGVQAALGKDDLERGTAELARARAAIGGVVIDRRFVDAKAQRIGSQLGKLAPDQQDRVAALLREAAQLSAAGDHAAANRKLNAIASQLGVR